MPYIGRSTDGFGIRETFTYVATNGATTISGADSNGRTFVFDEPTYVDVFLNGVRLKKDTDYNLNTANTIAGLTALSANDEIEIIVNDIFTLADMVSAQSGGDFNGSVGIKQDSGSLSFGFNKEITLTHVADIGLKLKNTSTTGNSGVGAVLTLQTGDTDIAVNNVLGDIQFQAPDEAAGTDAILVAAAIKAMSEGNFSASNNATKLSFHTAASAAAAETMSLSSTGVLTTSSNIVSGGTITGGGLLTTGGNVVIPDAGTIGSASDTNAIAISSAGVITISTNTDSSNSTTGALVAHSAGFADDVNIGDQLNVGGAISGSSTIIGTTITAQTAFVPDSSDGGSLGTSSLEFSDLYLADGGRVLFGNDADINLTHVADTGLTTNGSFTASGTMHRYNDYCNHSISFQMNLMVLTLGSSTLQF
jgi:mucin-19